MTDKTFDTSKSEAQPTIVDPVKISDFSFDDYLEYEKRFTEKCKKFF
jgi:hypothetical protein